MDDARRAVEAVARDSYGRLVAYLSSHTRDVAAAEDALGDALLAALDEAIYAAFGLGWDDGGGELAEEAIWLGRVLVEKRRNDPEARGLLALMLHGHARRAARRSPDGRYVPLSEQDPALWSRETIAEAEAELATASSERRPGRFQIEAAIQSAHAARARGGSVDWRAI